MRRVEPVKEYSPVIAQSKDNIWAMDLADMTADWVKENDGYRYILVVVDCFTRYAWCKPLKTKAPKEVWDALASVISSGVKPNFIWVDNGAEFYNAYWNKELKANSITRYSTYGTHKAAIAERFIRTLKNKLWYYFFAKGTRRWIDRLDVMVSEYNSSKHSTIGMTPEKARTAEGVKKLERQQPEPVLGNPKYAIGDWVRISRAKGTFEKGFHGRWSAEIFKIVGIRLKKPVLYKLQDYYGESIEGSFYEAELQPVADPSFFPVEKVLRKRTYKGVKEVEVKFIGYDRTRWMPAEQVGQLED